MFAVIYSAKLNAGDGDPLNGIEYIGQTVRAAVSAHRAMQIRAGQHVAHAKHEPKELGFRAALQIYGKDAFSWSVVASKVQASAKDLHDWVNDRECSEIKNRGGPLRDMDTSVPLEQTLNIAAGGQGDKVWISLEARSNRAWNTFANELQLFVDAFQTAYVHNQYRSPSGYALGFGVRSVRHGIMIVGKTQEQERRAWLESLPGWSWNARQSAEFKKAVGAASSARYGDFCKRRRENAKRRFEEQIANEPNETKKDAIRKKMAKRFKDSDARTARKLAAKKGESSNA